MEKMQVARARFGTFELDLRAGELQGNGRSVLLPDQVLQVLRILLEREGELVNREELKSKLWPNDTVVEFDHGINNTIKRLRKLLDDSAEEPKYVETIPRRGYRLMVAVEWVPTDIPSIEAPGNGGTAVRPQGELEAPISVGAMGCEPGLIGKKVSHYRVLEVIGGGGMGMVYKAEDLKLGREVALKFLPPELASDSIALQRFEREARAASSLDHANICTIYEVEEHDGQPFIVMQLLQGETLRDRLSALASTRKKMATDELLDIARQTCAGLEAAHAKGIIHRDIKPANVFLTASRQVKILDFGLAKLVETGDNERDVDRRPEAARLGPVESLVSGHAFSRAAAAPSSEMDGRQPVTLDATLTKLGVAMGTAGYMSPEQVRGEKLDARTDIFSFGLVLYEMTTGQRAFTGETAAVVHDAIVKNTPRPLRELNSMLPAKLVSVIDKALEKEREKRYQSAAEMRPDLEDLAERKTGFELPQRWRLYGVTALAVVVAVGGLLHWRANRPIKLTDKDTLVVADVINRTGDPLLDDSLDNPLSQELREAPYINLLNSGKIRETLESMHVPADAKFTPELAREVCLRTNSRAYVAPLIADNGNKYQIKLGAVDCHSGRTLATAETQADDRDHIINKLGVAGHNLRAALGEPAESLARFATPLEEDWTSSLQASKAISLGIRARQQKGDAAALPLLQRAVELDPKFVLALVNLGDTVAADNPELAKKDSALAFNLRDRVSLRTRFLTEGNYYEFVTGELEKANQTFLQWSREYPADIYPHQNLYDTLQALGQHDAAILQAQEAAHLLSNRQTYNILMSGFICANRLQEARAVFEEAKSRGMDDLPLRSQRYQVAFFENDAAAMQDLIARVPDAPEGRGWVSQQQGDAAIYQGRFRAAREFYSAIVDYLPDSADNLAKLALWEVETGNTAGAKENAGKALAANPGIATKGMLALTLARAGDLNQAEQLANAIARESPVDTLVQNYELPTIRAAIELSAGRAREAIRILKVSLPYDLATPNSFGGLYPCYIRGLAYLTLGEGQQAAAEFQKLVDHPGLGFPSATTALSRLQLARAQAMMSDKAAARKSYQDFLTLWKDADPDIPIYQQAKAEYAKLR